ncbi:MAG: hypothetical protein IPN70_02570 [Candidatus Moraniibacteriota bacterium]|nr:MAG: hypothetical protein IPN70_02570 [Candidatus Moranbacteria bacterium]
MIIKKEIFRFLFIIFVAVLAMFFTFRFTSNGIFEGILIYFMFFFLFPLLFILFVLKEKLTNFGFKMNISKTSLIWFSGILFGAVFFFSLFLWFFNKETEFMPPSVLTASFWPFFLYFFILLGSISLFYEIFFRGFIELGTKKILGYWSILFQWLLFISFLYFTKDLFFENGFFNWLILLDITSALSSGLLIYKTGSLFLSFLFSWFFGILISLISIIIYTL